MSEEHRLRSPSTLERETGRRDDEVGGVIKSSSQPHHKSSRRRNHHELSAEEMHQRMAALEKLLYDLIVTQSQRERVLINQIGKLQGELDRRTRAFNVTLEEYDRQLKLQQSKQQTQDVGIPTERCCSSPKDSEGCFETASSANSSVQVQSVSSESVALEDLQKYDIEYEEVILDKFNCEDNLGLVLCSAEENETGVFVEDVVLGSVAGRDGRIRSGDEIIEIDGVEVHTQQQANELFSATDKKAVTLVVARPHLKTERDLTSPESSADDCKRSVYSTDSSGERTLRNRFLVQSILEEDEDDEDEGIANSKAESKIAASETKECEDESSGMEKDSGVGKTDESIKNEESSEEENSHVPSLKNAETLKTSKSTSSRESKKSSPTFNKSNAIEMWVESTASPKHMPSEDLSLEMFLPPPPYTDNEDLISVVSCDNCRRCSCCIAPNYFGKLDRHEQLSRTIKLQQQLSSRVMNQSHSSVHSSPSRTIKSEPTLEWRVKKKPDGTKCIVRRPARVKMLKERAHQVAEERCGLTTDDDTMSEFKGGRYWGKEERRKHLERAKVRQKMRDEQQYARNHPATMSENSKQKCILEMSRRKMMQVKSQGVLDNFTTVQELMAHGSHSKNDVKVPHRLLAVTTV